jgi:hypothetical protein
MAGASDVQRERRRLRMESDWDPDYKLGSAPPVEHQMNNALDYAYQLGQINRKMDRLIAAVEKLVEKG